MDAKKNSTSGRLYTPGGANGVQQHSNDTHLIMPDTAAKSFWSGLAAKSVLPLILVILLCMSGSAVLVARIFGDIQRDDMVHDAAATVTLAAGTGRIILMARQEFFQKHPEYRTAQTWAVGRHWALDRGLVSPEMWRSANGGAELTAEMPVEMLERSARATLLRGMASLIDQGEFDNDVVEVLLLDVDGEVVARTSAMGFDDENLDAASVPLPSGYMQTVFKRVYVDSLNAPGGVYYIRGTAVLYSRQDKNREVGRVMVVLRQDRHTQSRNILMYAILSGMLISFVGVVLSAWLSVRRVVQPVRRLARDMRAIAEGDLERRSSISTDDEIGQLARTFNAMAERLRLARSTEMETNRLESDLAVAKNIQDNLLPLRTPLVRGFDIHTSYKPAREIGGDYFDFLPVDNGHIGIAVADASGKSIPAALVMSTTRAILRFTAPGDTSAADVLSRINAVLAVDIPKGMFVTAYYIILDPVERTMICSSAGHNPLLLGRADGTVETINPGGIALGFDSGPIFRRSIREQHVQLQTGDRVLVYTDGVIECVNPGNEEYSERRLREFLRRNRDMSSYDFVGALRADLDSHRGTADVRDDTTIVTFKVV